MDTVPNSDTAQCPPECAQNWTRASDPLKHVDHCPVGNQPVNEQIVWDAQVALANFHPETPEQVVDMLLFWRRRSELTPADIAEVCERMFPKPLERMECPAWCETDHTRGRYNTIENLCEHTKDVLVVSDDEDRVKLQVYIAAVDDLTERYRHPAGVMVQADEPLSQDQVIDLIGALTEGLRIIG